jgi:hypothetical protein
MWRKSNGIKMEPILTSLVPLSYSLEEQNSCDRWTNLQSNDSIHVSVWRPHKEIETDLKMRSDPT